MLPNCRQCKWYLSYKDDMKDFCLLYRYRIGVEWGCDNGEIGRIDNNELKEEENSKDVEEK